MYFPKSSLARSVCTKVSFVIYAIRAVIYTGIITYFVFMFTLLGSVMYDDHDIPRGALIQVYIIFPILAITSVIQNIMFLIIWRQRVRISRKVTDEHSKRLLFQENQRYPQNSNQQINPGAHYITANYGQNYYHQQHHDMHMGAGGMNNMHQIQPLVSANHSESSSENHNNMINANP